MGAVYRAIDQDSGEPVAVKIIRDGIHDAGERFAREARILAKLRHPAIVRYIDHGVTAEQGSYLVMEWLEGQDLGQRLTTGALSRAEAITLASRVADGLAAAHAGGILHRDIKPTNVFLPDGDLERAKLLDFGIARDTTAVQGLTQTGAVIGTPAYMSPEQAEGQSELTGGSDIFSLGSVLFECLSGTPPFSGGHVFAVLAKVIFDATPHVRDVVPELDRSLDSLVAQMMCKRPAERPTAAAVRRALAGLSASGDEIYVPVEGDHPSSITAREQRLVSVVAARAVSSMALPTAPAVDPRDDGNAATLLGIGHDETAADLSGPVQTESPVDAAARRYGAQVARLIDGSVVAVLEGADAATDLAVRSARLALELRGVLGAARVVVATGHVLMSGKLPVGEVIDRATALLSTRSGSICIDTLTAGLLPRRFALGVEAEHAVLLGIHDVADGERTLLGKTTRCVGRHRELATLQALYDECVDEPMARAVLVSGPPGIGKSRVARQLVRTLETEHDAEVFVGRGDPVSADSALSLLREALRKSLGFHDDDPPEARRRQIEARVHALIHGSGADRVARFLGEIVGAEFSDDDVELHAARQDARLMGDQMKRAFEAWIGACCRERPVVLLLEDVQWADKVSIAFVDSALRRLANEPLLVLAVARDSVDEMFPKLWENRPVDRVRIGPLRKRAATELVRDTLGSADDVVVAELVQRAAGNAFYLEELIRSFADRGTTDAPETVLAMLQARIQKLPRAARRVLRGASLFGLAFWRAGVEVIAGDGDSENVIEQLALLEHEEIIASRPASRFAGESEYAFSHSLMRDAAYETLPEDDRQTGHRMVGEWLRDVGESDPIVLAEHFQHGHCNHVAATYFEHGARNALEGSDYATAIRHCKRAMDAGAESEVLARVLLIAAESHRQRREYDVEAGYADRCLQLTDPGTPLWYRAMVEANLAAAFASDHARLLELAQRVRLVENPRDAAAHVGTLALYASNLYFVGQNAAAEEIGDEMEARAHEVGDDPVVTTRMAGYRARRAILSGDIARYIAAHDDVARQLERVGRLRDVPERHCKVAYGLVLAGRYLAARELLVQTRAAAERHGLENTIATADQNMGLIELRLGNADGAVEILARNAEQAAARTAPMHEGVARAYLAEALIAQGQGARAEVEAQRAVELLDGNPAFGPMAWAQLASARRHGDNKAAALDAASTAMSRLKAAGSVEEGAELARLEWALALHHTGDRAAAERAIAAAAQAVTDKASRISDAGLRASFLESVPVNAQTLRLAASWTTGSEHPA